MPNLALGDGGEQIPITYTTENLNAPHPNNALITQAKPTKNKQFWRTLAHPIESQVRHGCQNSKLSKAY